MDIEIKNDDEDGEGIPECIYNRMPVVLYVRMYVFR